MNIKPISEQRQTWAGIEAADYETDADKSAYHQRMADHFRHEGFDGSADHHQSMADMFEQRDIEQAGFMADGEAIKAQEAEQARRDDQEVLERFTNGHNVIVGAGGRPWWAKSGNIERTLQVHEIDALDRLEKRGVVSMSSTRYAI